MNTRRVLGIAFIVSCSIAAPAGARDATPSGEKSRLPWGLARLTAAMNLRQRIAEGKYASFPAAQKLLDGLERQVARGGTYRSMAELVLGRVQAHLDPALSAEERATLVARIEGISTVAAARTQALELKQRSGELHKIGKARTVARRNHQEHGWVLDLSDAAKKAREVFEKHGRAIRSANRKGAPTAERTRDRTFLSKAYLTWAHAELDHVRALVGLVEQQSTEAGLDQAQTFRLRTALGAVRTLLQAGNARVNQRTEPSWNSTEAWALLPEPTHDHAVQIVRARLRTTERDLERRIVAGVQAALPVADRLTRAAAAGYAARGRDRLTRKEEATLVAGLKWLVAAESTAFNSGYLGFPLDRVAASLVEASERGERIPWSAVSPEDRRSLTSILYHRASRLTHAFLDHERDSGPRYLPGALRWRVLDRLLDARLGLAMPELDRAEALLAGPAETADKLVAARRLYDQVWPIEHLYKWTVDPADGMLLSAQSKARYGEHLTKRQRATLDRAHAVIQALDPDLRR
ncbi:MAG: hypothetical protein IT371_21640 [Deltaproteobacteria bacterium]|nr:hypothetical protein [Deltaproteobacteria bacterium]